MALLITCVLVKARLAKSFCSLVLTVVTWRQVLREEREISAPGILVEGEGNVVAEAEADEVGEVGGEVSKGFGERAERLSPRERR